MKNREFGEAFEQRTQAFAISVIKLTRQLPDSYEGKALKNQLLRSGTSIGANYREANRSKSKTDFKYKIRVCEGEASETIYWLSILEELTHLDRNQLSPVVKEGKEILAILTKISSTLRLKSKQHLPT